MAYTWAIFGVVQLGSRLRLDPEPLKQGGVAGQILRQHFQGNPPLQTGVLGQVDLTHASSSERAFDSVMEDGVALLHALTPW